MFVLFGFTKITILKEIHSLLGNAEHPNPGSPFCWRPPGNEFEKRLLSSPISEVKGYMYACFNDSLLIRCRMRL